MTRSLSIVIPMLNEAGGVPLLLDDLKTAREQVRKLGIESEVILVDDGSTDGTRELADEWVRRWESVRVIHLTRNFGHQAALTAGLEVATGDAVVMMDADGEHPADMVPEMVEAWLSGAMVVNTKRRSHEAASTTKRGLSSLFYWLVARSSEYPPAPGHSDFRLVDRLVVKELLGSRSHTMFFRGLVPWLGFSATEIEFESPRRRVGVPAYSFGKSLHLALAGVVTYTRLPLLIVVQATVVLFAFFLGYGLYILDQRFISGTAVPGQASVLFLIMITSLVQMSAVAVAVLYAYRAYREVSGQPLYVVEAVVSDPSTPQEAGRQVSDGPDALQR